MSKRKQNNEDGDGDESDASLVDVDFDFFDPNPDVDYLAVKRLANKLWQNDTESLQVHDLADLILAQPHVGTTIKCDGKESDPYAVLSVINLHVHQSRPFVKALIDYVLAKSAGDPSFQSTLRNLLGPEGLQSQNHVGFVFSERLINMPVELMPPMYHMLSEELTWALDEDMPFRFSHYLFVSQTYKLSAEEAAEMEANAPRNKRQKAAAAVAAASRSGVIPVHREDEEIEKLASHTTPFVYSNTEPRDKESIGLETAGKLMLMSADRLPQLVAALQDAFPAPGQ